MCVNSSGNFPLAIYFAYRTHSIFVDEGVQRNTSSLLSLGLSRTSPPPLPHPSFSGSLAIVSIYRSTLLRRVCRAAPSPSTHFLAASVSPSVRVIAMACAKKIFSFSNPQSFARYNLSMSHGRGDNRSSSMPTAIARFEGRPQTGHVHLKP